ncbi:MAG TPA: M48 family metalloprotease [Gaiellaceae bacterium]|jgi:STE24 endopeptidase|nr:M48 family metalloprotease [Gaiellaceae bacterium]
MTAIRTRRFWVIGAFAAGWLVAAALLWRAELPPGDIPSLDAEDAFSRAYLDRSERYQRFHRVNWALATLVELVVLVLCVRLAPRARVSGVGGGVLLAAGTLIAVWVASVPFLVAGHWWRRRYDVSDAGYARILVDPWLERIGGLAVAVAAIALLMLLARRLGDRWWLVGGPAFAAVGAAFLVAQPFLLSPRVEPLRDEALAADIRALAREQGVGEVEVQVRDASRRTRAVNAEFYGVGPTKRIVIWDTALEQLSRDELRVLVAHEFAHVDADHVWKGIAWLFLFAVPGAWVVARVTRLRGGLGRPAAVPLALLTLTVLQLVLQPATNAISRRYEREADWLGLQAEPQPVAFEGLTRQLTRAALAQPDPPAWARVVFGTHPTPLERIELARTLRAEEPRGGS